MTSFIRMRGNARIPVLLLLAVAVAAGLGLVAARLVFSPPQTAAPATPPMQNAMLYPQPRPIPPFTLQRPNGATLTNADLLGHWTLLFIGFTHCPDVCPTTLADLARLKTHWSAPSAQPRVLFVAVDPERDTAERAQEYAAFFDPAFLGASGTLEQLQAFTASVGLVFMKTPLQGDDYTVDHSARLAILGPDGALHGLIPPPHDPVVMASDLAALAAARPSGVAKP